MVCFSLTCFLRMSVSPFVGPSFWFVIIESKSEKNAYSNFPRTCSFLPLIYLRFDQCFFPPCMLRMANCIGHFHFNSFWFWMANNLLTIVTHPLKSMANSTSPTSLCMAFSLRRFLLRSIDSRLDNPSNVLKLRLVRPQLFSVNVLSRGNGLYANK